LSYMETFDLESMLCHDSGISIVKFYKHDYYTVVMKEHVFVFRKYM
jgi:hypothetical protein